MLRSILSQGMVEIPEPSRDDFARIQGGDTILREEMLLRYDKAIRLYLGTHHHRCKPDDAYSIALSALNEALTTFRPEMARSFKNHAYSVIKCRLIDEDRRNNRENVTFPFSWFQKNDQEQNHFEETWLVAETTSLDVRLEFRDELDAFHKMLKSFNITMDDLFHAAPHHLDSRRLAVKIGFALANDKKLYGMMAQKHAVPVNQLARICKVNNKTIIRHKDYIMLIALIWNSRMDVFREYVRDLLKEGDSHD